MTSGYKINPNHNFTKENLETLCSNLAARFYNTCEFKLSPSGDIEWVEFPGKTDRMYKAMSISCENMYSTFYDYYKIDENIFNALTLITLENEIILNTYLKAYRGAPCWSLNELRIFEEEFKKIGMTIVGKYPEKYHLTNKYNFV